MSYLINSCSHTVFQFIFITIKSNSLPCFLCSLHSCFSDPQIIACIQNVSVLGSESEIYSKISLSTKYQGLFPHECLFGYPKGD